MSETRPGQAADQHPVLFDHYQVIEVLGHGAMGIVYLVRDVRIGRLAALKTLRLTQLPAPMSEEAEEFLSRFKREAEVCGSLMHPNIVTLYEVGYANRQIRYLAMEYVEGQSLSTLLQRQKRLSVLLASRIILDILGALDYAHDRRIIHRDIKPANILVTSQGHAKIADFGVARSVREGISQVTRQGHLLGTPYYMAPEHIAGREVDGRSDLFSVGVMFFELLSGRRPFEGESIMDVLYDVVNKPTPTLRSIAPDLPRWAEIYVSRLLQKDPRQRFLSAGAASAELERLMELHKRDAGIVGTAPAMTELVRRELAPEETPTTPIRSRKAWWRQLFNRSIPRRIAVASLILFAALVAAPIIWMSSRTFDEGSSAELTLENREVEKKRRLLNEAQVLFDAGAYAHALERYDQVLAEYPDTTAAVQGREKALRHLYPLDPAESR